MRILGIDPGLRLTGYGVVDYHPLKPGLVDGGVIRLDADAPLAARLVELSTELEAILIEHEPDVCAVEELYAHYAHPRTAILMGHARGVILLAAARRGVRLEQYPANRVKQSVTGHGHAAKHQVQRAIQNTWNLPAPPEPPDVADALAVALCCGRALDGLAHRAAKVPSQTARRSSENKEDSSAKPRETSRNKTRLEPKS